MWPKLASPEDRLRCWSLVLGNIATFAKVAVFREACGKSWRLTIRGRDPVSVSPNWSLVIVILLQKQQYFARRVAKAGVYVSGVKTAFPQLCVLQLALGNRDACAKSGSIP